jgi:hypothetical protein
MRISDILDALSERIMRLSVKDGTKLEIIDVLTAIHDLKEEYGYLEVDI